VPDKPRRKVAQTLELPQRADQTDGATDGPWAEPVYLAALARHAGLPEGPLPLPAEHHVQVGGLRMRYLDWGDPKAPPLVLLHGGGQSARTWDTCCLLLARRWRCIALDQRGHGHTDWSAAGHYRLEDHAADLADFLKLLELHQPVLVGMSMGGVNAIACAGWHTPALRAMVFVDIGPEVQAGPVDRMMKGLESYRFFESPQAAAAQMAGMGARRDQTLLRETLLRNLRRLDDGRWTWRYDPRTMIGLTAQTILAERRPLWGLLPRIQCPALVLRGADSEIFTDADAQRFAQALPNARWQAVPKARHSVQTDNPCGLAAAIESFLQSLHA
jgi:pimeloyl-ACP methyl ester carboxylesterase